MGRLQQAWKALMGKKAAPMGLPRYEVINGQLVGIADKKKNYITEGYTANDTLYAVVNLILDKVRLPEWGVYQVKDPVAKGRYEALMRRKNLSAADHAQAVELKHQALELVEIPKLSPLLKYPNQYETFQDLVANATGYKLITGDRYIMADLLGAGANSGKPQQLHVLPSHEISIVADRSTFPLQEAGYCVNATNIKFSPEQILHDKYWNPDFDLNGSHLYGLSPIKAALRTLTRNNSAKKSSAAMFQNQGVKGVLYMDDPRVLQGGYDVASTTKQVEAIKEKLTQGEWAGEYNHGRIGFSGYKMGWQSVGLSPVDLNVIESEKWDAIMLCNIYGVPPELLGLTAKTYNNVKEAEVSLTSRCAMPQLVSLRDALNRKLKTHWGFTEGDLFVDFDQTVFTELQEDVKHKADWVGKLLGLSPNEQRLLLGLETIDHPLFDEPWITAQMGSPLSEWNIDGNMGEGDESLPDNG